LRLAKLISIALVLAAVVVGCKQDDAAGSVTATTGTAATTPKGGNSNTNKPSVLPAGRGADSRVGSKMGGN